jgi:hypothetical protein
MSATVLQKNPTEREEKLEGKEGASVLQKNSTEKDLEKLNEKEKKEETNAQGSAVGIESRKKATRTTHNLIILASFFFFVSIIFLILVSTTQPRLLKCILMKTDRDWKHHKPASPEIKLLSQAQCHGHTSLNFSYRRTTRELYCAKSRHPRLLPSWSMEFLRGL